MKERILTGWTFKRGLYFLIGILLITQAIINREWPGVFFGAYFCAMGLFAIGCAAGNCAGGSCYTKPQKQNNAVQDAGLEEIK